MLNNFYDSFLVSFLFYIRAIYLMLLFLNLCLRCLSRNLLRRSLRKNAFWSISFKFWVKPIFDRIISSSIQDFCDLTPSIPNLTVHLKNNLVFFLRPLFLFNVWVKVIMPSLSALFSDSSGQGLGNCTPISRPIWEHHRSKDVIFLLSPWSFRGKARGWVRGISRF